MDTGLNLLISYITVAGGERTFEFARRFATTWELFPPRLGAGPQPQLTVIGNGGPPCELSTEALSPLNPKLRLRPNVGADIGAYIEVARSNPGVDALLCLGESVYFHRAGWLDRIEQVWKTRGPGLYGFYSSNLVRPHLNTTAFLCPPKPLSAYPETIVTRSQRYQFEHGENPFWRRAQSLGLPVRLITWDGDYSSGEWRAPANILWKGDQSNCLFFCIHTDRYHNGTEKIRRTWEKNADIGIL